MERISRRPCTGFSGTSVKRRCASRSQFVAFGVSKVSGALPFTVNTRLVEYFGHALALHHGTSEEPLGRVPFETVWKVTSFHDVPQL